MEKKGQIAGMVVIIVGLVFAIMILSTLAFPQVRTMTTAQTVSEEFASAHVLGTETNVTLANTDMVSGGLSISGLTLTDNYTINYNTALVTINDTTNNGTYTAAYSYYGAGYIESTGTRALAALVILLIIVGLFAGSLKMFGVF